MARCRDFRQRRGLVELTLAKEKLTMEEMKMTSDIHVRGSGRSHNKRKENAIEIGRRKISNEEFDREIVELK